MTLRSRLLLAAALILVMVTAGGVFIVRGQQSYLIGQLDDRLSAIRPLFGPPPGGPSAGGPYPIAPESDGSADPPDSELSSLYVGIVDGDGVRTTLRGQLLGDVPRLDAATLQRAGLGAAEVGTTRPITVDGMETDTRFRATLHLDPRTDTTFVIALPLDEVDQAVDQLRVVLLVGGGAIAVVLMLSVWWVERLGLRPVARVTEVADAIARGARGLRVEEGGRGTEADRLAAAFNVMLDEREETEQRLRRFISDASHELRTPLTSIRGYLDLYRDGAFRGEGELDDVVRRLSRESSRMQELVEDLLLLAKLDEHPPLRSEVVDVGGLLEDAATDARALQPERPITVEVADPPVLAVGDTVRLQQVVGILVANALAHTDRPVAVRLLARRAPTGPAGPPVPAGGSGAIVVISDDGPGLDPADAEHVFDRFYRGDPSRTRATGGAGLGLAIARSILDAHGGTVGLETAVGQGCTFTVHLPGPSAVRSDARS